MVCSANGAHLVEVEHEVKFAYIVKEGVWKRYEHRYDDGKTLERTEDLDEQVDGLQVRQLIVVRIDTDAEEQTSISPVHDLVVPELKWART